MDKIEQPEGRFSLPLATDDVTSGGGGGMEGHEHGTEYQAVDDDNDDDNDDNDNNDVEPSSLYDHLALDLSGYDTVDLNPVDDAVMHSNDGVADHPLSSSLSSPSRQLPDNGDGNGGDTSKPTTLGRTSRKGRTLRPVKDTIQSAPPKKRLRKSASTNPQSTGSSTASKPPPVPPPPPPPEVYYPHLATPQPPSLLTDTTILQRRRARWKQLADAEGDPIPPTEICGLPVPKKRHDACAACGMTGEDDGNNILLCDGPNCGQEYHMNCCIPPVQRIPTGKFYCFDCNRSGTSVQLAEYFQQHEERKDQHERLCLQQLAPASTTATPTSSKKRKKAMVIVDSFIDTLLQDDVAAESTETNPLTTGSSITVIKSKALGGRRSRGTDNEEDTVLLPISELKHIHHEHLIGKPVRLYCSNMNTYHNGRILDTRSADDSTVALVRFPAGKDHRKTTLTQWIYLEEHCLAVASDLVWAWMGNTSKKTKKRSGEEAQWTLGKLWRRTGRELVPVMKQLNEAEGQICFRALREPTDAPNDTASNTAEVEKDEIKSQTDNDNTTTSTAPTLAPIVPRWGLVESFDGAYELLNLEEETKLEPPSSGPKVNDPIISGLAKVELQEQRCIQWWKALPLHNPFLALRAQDPSWPSLEFEMPVEKECVRPSSLVDLGLDREMMVKLVAQHLGMEPTKDLGVGLACETVDCLASMIQSITPRL